MITARPDAPLGTVLHPDRYSASLFTPGSAVLCRNTAPLVRFCYDLLLRDIPCRIAGKEIGTSLIALARSAKTSEVAGIKQYAQEWHNVHVARALEEGRSPERYDDQANALLFLMTGLFTLSELEARVARIFDDTPGAVVLLSTIHKAKGGEWDKVFLLDFATLLPSKYARQHWQRQQERNLQYVAVTRSRDVLVFIESDKWEDDSSKTNN